MFGRLEKIVNGLNKAIITTALVASLFVGCSEENPVTTSSNSNTTKQNNPPAFVSSPVTSVDENQSYNYQVKANDIEGDKITYSLEKNPLWMSISSSGLISGIAPEVSKDEITEIAIKAFDGKSANQQKYNLTIKNTYNVYSMNSEQTGKLINVDSTKLSFSQAMNFLPGDIVVSDINNKAPDGFLRKINSISSDKKILYTENASLEETIKNGNFEFSGKIFPNNASLNAFKQGINKSASTSAFDFNIDINNTIIYDFDGDDATTDDRLKVTGNISFNLDYELSGKVNKSSLEELIFKIIADEKLDIKISSPGNLGWFSKYIPLGEYSFKSFIIGYTPTTPPIPIIVKPKLEVGIEFSGGIKTLEVGVSQELTYTAGVSYKKGQWLPINSLSYKFNVDYSKLTSPNFGFEVNVGPTVKFPLYNIAGPKGKLSAGIELQTSSDKWQLYGGLEASIGVEMKIFKHVFADFNAQVLNHKLLLKEGTFIPTEKILFSTTRDGNAQIYIMNADGSEQINLNNSSSWDTYPCWAPDASKILYSSLPSSNSNSDIYVMNADGSNKTKLTNSSKNESNSVFSSDGTKIVYTSSYSPEYAQIYIMNADGSSPMNITNDDNHYYRDLSWAPNSRIACKSNKDNSNSEIYTLNSNGSDIKRLTNNSYEDSHPCWSPDRNRIAFRTNRDGNSEIYVMNADGSNQTNVSNNSSTYDSSPSWSPDGTKIVYSSGSDLSSEIWIMNSDGSNKKRLTNNSYLDGLPRWAPK